MNTENANKSLTAELRRQLKEELGDEDLTKPTRKKTVKVNTLQQKFGLSNVTVALRPTTSNKHFKDAR